MDFKIIPTNLEGTHFDIDISFKKVDSFAQKILLILNTWESEFVYDTKKGIDYRTVLNENFNAKYLESFFLYSLKKQLKSFDTFTNYKINFNKETKIATITFTAFSKTGESVMIENFEL